MNTSTKPSILISLPAFGSSIDAYTAGGIFHLGTRLKDLGIKCGLYIVMNESFIPSARNRIAAEFLLTDFTHLMCIDADMGFESEDVLKLLHMNKDFVAAEYFTKSDTSRTTARYLPNGDAIGVGMGFVMLTKHVFQRLMPAVEVLDAPDSWKMKNYYNFFGPIVDKNVLLSEDISFCKRWADVGGKIYIDHSIQLRHFGRYTYGQPKNK